jgi:predicted nucleic-acid-binding protein
VIGLDTKVLVRLLVEDDEGQRDRALAVLEPAWDAGEPAFVSDVVLAELEWVLDTAYRVPREGILAAVHAMLEDERFAVEDLARLTAALRLYQTARGDLSDYLIGLAAASAGAVTTLTFDRALTGDGGFRVL